MTSNIDDLNDLNRLYERTAHLIVHLASVSVHWQRIFCGIKTTKLFDSVDEACNDDSPFERHNCCNCGMKERIFTGVVEPDKTVQWWADALVTYRKFLRWIGIDDI